MNIIFFREFGEGFRYMDSLLEEYDIPIVSKVNNPYFEVRLEDGTVFKAIPYLHDWEMALCGTTITKIFFTASEFSIEDVEYILEKCLYRMDHKAKYEIRLGDTDLTINFRKGKK